MKKPGGKTRLFFVFNIKGLAKAANSPYVTLRDAEASSVRL
jgi:hypothetical protein